MYELRSLLYTIYNFSHDDVYIKFRNTLIKAYFPIKELSQYILI